MVLSRLCVSFRYTLHGSSVSIGTLIFFALDDDVDASEGVAGQSMVARYASLSKLAPSWRSRRSRYVWSWYIGVRSGLDHDVGVGVVR